MYQEAFRRQFFGSEIRSGPEFEMFVSRTDPFYPFSSSLCISKASYEEEKFLECDSIEITSFNSVIRDELSAPFELTLLFIFLKDAFINFIFVVYLGISKKLVCV